METVFDIWDTAAALARDIGADPTTVRHWRRRKSIPAKYDLDLVEAARRRGHELALSDLAEARRMAARSKQDAA
jgi:hypothetical protein